MKRGTKAVIAGGLLAVLVALFFVDPAQMSILSCPFKEATGCSCLTCGMSRSLHALAHGEVLNSFRFHVMGPVLFVGVLALLFIFAYESIAGKSFPFRPTTIVRRRTTMLFALTWGLFWVIRLAGELHVY
ncbi:MAG: DUF2752 domain-containing protein [Bacteroidota bacterium]